MKNLNFNIKNFKIDGVSKFNLYEKNFSSFDHLIFFTKLYSNDSNFFRDFFFLSKLFCF